MSAETNGSDATRAIEEVLAVFESLGYPRDVVTQWSIPAPDACDLVAQLRASLPPDRPARILEVGTFVGTSALVMLRTLPHAIVHTIDPNFPLQVEFDAMNCTFRDADLARRTQQIAAAAAEVLGVRDRLVLHAGGFAAEATFAGQDATVPAIGEQVIARHGPFDAVFVDGLHFEEVVLADLRLAATAVRAQAPILMHDVIGYWGSCVRRAVGRLLEQVPQFGFSHAPYADLYRSIGRLSTQPDEVLSPVARAARCFGEHAPRHAEYAARALAATFPSLAAHACDELSKALGNRIGAESGAPRCAVALGSLDEVAPAATDAALARIAAGCDVLVLGFTPPGEHGASGAWSRPLASRVARLDACGFDAYDLIVPFLEPFSYALGGGCILPAATTFLSTSVVAVRRGTAAAARVADRTPVTPSEARRIDDSRTQRCHERAMLARFRADCAYLSGQVQRVHADTDARGAENRRLQAELEGARTGLGAEVARLSSRLQHMLDWRMHVGPLHFWRRPKTRA